MTANDLFLLIVLIAMLGFVIFVISAIINMFKKEPAKDDWLKAFAFLVLTLVFFTLFGLTI